MNMAIYAIQKANEETQICLLLCASDVASTHAFDSSDALGSK